MTVKHLKRNSNNSNKEEPWDPRTIGCNNNNKRRTLEWLAWRPTNYWLQ